MASLGLRTFAKITGAAGFARSLRNFARFAPLYRKYRRETMVGKRDFLANLDAVHAVARRADLANGAIVECGTWRGGMSAALIEVGGPNREYHFFDSFAGLPPARPIDGPQALAWQRDSGGRFYHQNCTASREEFEATIARTGISQNRVHVHAGPFETTLNVAMPPIAVLRLDADWYDSTAICLDRLFDLVMPGGIILIDDYYVWDGCARAVHDFLSRRSLPARIRQRSEQLALIVKELPETGTDAPGS